MNEITKKLIEAVKNDLTPSLGVTEPGAIAYTAAEASKAIGGRVLSVSAKLNSGVYKNSFTCAVPGTGGMGCALAAALGAVCGDPDKKLMATEGASFEDIGKARQLVSEGKATAELSSISPEIRIEAEVKTENGLASALITGKHDHIAELTVNGSTVFREEAAGKAEETGFKVSSVSLYTLLDCIEEAEELDFVDEAVKMNLTLFEEGEKKGLMPLTTARRGFDHAVISSPRDRADHYTCGAIEARVRGANSPAMAITGSGSHGILCTLPVHCAAEYYGFSDRQRRRALLLSMLVTMFIKENSGLLSTACGCVLAGGTGACLGITYLFARNAYGPNEPKRDRAAVVRMLTDALNSMAASVTGMICHGGNSGCSLKASVGVNMAFSAAEMALDGAGAESVHGILGDTPEETMRNMGRIARDMLPVEKTILDIMSCKSRQDLL